MQNFGSTDATHYSFVLVPVTGGEFTAKVEAGQFHDALDNPNTASTLLTRTYDNVAPEITLSSDAGKIVGGNIAVHAALSEESTTFTKEDVTVMNATVGAFNGSGTSYNFTVKPVKDGAFTVQVDSNKFTDTAGNGNTSSDVLERLYTSTGELLVLEPNGGEKWKLGKTASIEWVPTPDIEGSVKIELYKNGTKVKVIKKETANDGELEWKVKDTVEAGGGYRVHIKELDGDKLMDDSDGTFRIRADKKLLPGADK